MSYITVQELRDEGVASDYTDVWLTERITLAQQFVEKLTRTFFERRDDYSMELDGSGHDLLLLPVPPVSTSAITSVSVDDTVLDATEYKVIMPDLPDGRLNPRLRRLLSSWPKGTCNITVVGAFGFVEADGSTPPLIKDAVKRIAVWNLPAIADVEGQRSAQILQESLKDYSYQLAQPSGGMFNDFKIDNIISMFRRTSIRTV